MPLYYYKCSTCEKEFRRICSPAESLFSPECCSKKTKRNPHPVSTRCVETLDNGVMTKKIERLVDAERLFHERYESTKRIQNGD